MSGQTGCESIEYCGVINGIVYRFTNNVADSETVFEIAPLGINSAAVGESLLASLDNALASGSSEIRLPLATGSTTAEDTDSPPPAEATVEPAVIQEQELPVRLFAREGAEPLRAGHPDLWRLLVAGTCLEGSTFRSL